MAALRNPDPGLQILVHRQEIFVAVVIESDVIGGQGKALEQKIDPAWAVQIIVFDDVDDAIGMNGLLCNDIEKFEKGYGFGSRFDRNDLFVGMPGQKMSFGIAFGGIEDKRDIGF